MLRAAGSAALAAVGDIVREVHARAVARRRSDGTRRHARAGAADLIGRAHGAACATVGGIALQAAAGALAVGRGRSATRFEHRQVIAAADRKPDEEHCDAWKDTAWPDLLDEFQNVPDLYIDHFGAM